MNSFSQLGKRKDQRYTPPNKSSHHDDFQALTPVDPGDFVKIKGWDGHSTHGGRLQDGWAEAGRSGVEVYTLESGAGHC